MQCEKCGGDCWDNRQKKTNPKAPDFKCKDVSCGWVKWPPRISNREPISQGMKALADKTNTLMDGNRLEALRLAVECTKSTGKDPLETADRFLNYLNNKSEKLNSPDDEGLVDWVEEQMGVEK